MDCNAGSVLFSSALEHLQLHEVFVEEREIVSTSTVPNIATHLNSVFCISLTDMDGLKEGWTELFVRVRHVIINLYFIRKETANEFNLCSLMCSLHI
jgi:hypothetical protein